MSNKTYCNNCKEKTKTVGHGNGYHLCIECGYTKPHKKKKQAEVVEKKVDRPILDW